MSTDQEPQTSLTKLKRFSYASDTWQQRVDQRLWNKQTIMEHNGDDDHSRRPPSLPRRQNGYEEPNEESFLSWEVEEFSTGLLAVSNAFARASENPKEEEEELQSKYSVSVEGSLQRLSGGAPEWKRTKGAQPKAPPPTGQAQSDDITPEWDPNVESARWSRSVPFLLLPSAHESERSGEETSTTTSSTTLSSSRMPKKATTHHQEANFHGQRKVHTCDRSTPKNIDDKLKEFKKDLRSMNQRSATSRKSRPGSAVTPMAAIAEENHLTKSIELIGDGGRTVHVDLYRHVAARPTTTTTTRKGNATMKEKSRKGQQKGAQESAASSSDRRNPFRNLRRLLGLSTSADTSTQWRFHSLRHFPSSLSWSRGSSTGKEAARSGFLHGADYCAASQELLNSSSVNVKELAEIRISEDNNGRDSVTLSDSMGPRSGTISSTRSSNYLTASMTDCSTLTKQHPNSKLNPIEEETSRRSTTTFQSAKSSETYSNEATSQQGTQRASLLYLSTIGYICHNFPKRANLWWRRHGRCGTSSKLCWKDVTLRSNKPVLVSRIAVYYDGFMSVGVVPAKYKNPWPKTRPMPFTLPCVVEMRENLNSELLCCQECWQANTVCTHCEQDQQSIPCTVYILPKAELCTTKQVVSNYARTLADSTTTADLLVSIVNKFNFLMIQLITVFKFLQSMGIEETKNDLEDIVVMQMEADRMPRVTLEWDSVFIDERMTSNSKTADLRPKLPLCKVAAAQLVEVLNVLNDRCADGAATPIPNVNKWYAVFPLFKMGLAKAAHVLFEGKCDALTRAQTLLQYLFWVVGKTDRLMTEDRARIWLDNQRVALLCHLVKRMLNPLYEIDVEEHYRLLFLLHASSKSLLDAERMTLLLRSSNETTTT
ncbi:hypothetical protein M513_00470 [Trichuris suis]|uniref:Uncharacterized protein n=1 Tax=Trichuris suis TaxID=68888 RepID=A0A085MNI1_9BILA|nr:hypothetical protein M513_00470 [Trichuris suis]